MLQASAFLDALRRPRCAETTAKVASANVIASAGSGKRVISPPQSIDVTTNSSNCNAAFPYHPDRKKSGVECGTGNEFL
jgi:hypothetical protein